MPSPLRANGTSPCVGCEDAAELVGEQDGNTSLFRRGTEDPGGGREPVVTTRHSPRADRKVGLRVDG